MNLNHEELEELNSLLSSRKIKIPDFRRKVGPTGVNLQWLKTNLMKFNSSVVNERIKQLLGIHELKQDSKAAVSLEMEVIKVNPTLETGENV
jgi:hypothetical protein